MGVPHPPPCSFPIDEIVTFPTAIRPSSFADITTLDVGKFLVVKARVIVVGSWRGVAGVGGLETAMSQGEVMRLVR